MGTYYCLLNALLVLINRISQQLYHFQHSSAPSDHKSSSLDSMTLLSYSCRSQIPEIKALAGLCSFWRLQGRTRFIAFSSFWRLPAFPGSWTLPPSSKPACSIFNPHNLIFVSLSHLLVSCIPLIMTLVIALPAPQVI